MATPSGRAALFATDLTRLKREWTDPSSRQRGPDDSYQRTLRAKLLELATGEQGDRWYLPHRVLLHLLEGTPEALAQAKQAFLMEWSHGQDLDRRTHYWNSHQFRVGDRWICAAMLAQLLILWDWLAAAGAFSEEEIDAVAAEALDVVEAHLEPHNKGRGHMPLLQDPINQNAAVVAGMLYAGYMFGSKWRQAQRAQRLYASARNLLADCIGQFPGNGYDSDGMTYARHIHMQVYTLAVALLEEVEGGDWYHRKFAPFGNSLADLNARQLDFVAPSGWSWPLGRYGYIKSWNLFCQSFAARRTNDPRYLQVARRDNDLYDFKSPWLGMDLPLGLLWYPTELDQGITREMPPIKPRRGVQADSWAIFTGDGDRMLAVATWLPGKAPHFFLEAHGSPLILSGCEMWATSNGVQCEPAQWGWSSWMNPAGELRRYCDIPGLQAAYIETTPSYPKSVAVQRATRVFAAFDDGMIVSDRFSSASQEPVIWQAAAWKDTQIQGAVAKVRGLNDVTLRAVSAAGEWRFRLTPERKMRMETVESTEMGMLELEAPAGKGEFDVLLDWGQGATSAELSRERADLLAIRDRKMHGEGVAGSAQAGLKGVERTSLLLLPGMAGLRNIGAYQTDADVALLYNDGRLCLAGARSLRTGEEERVWASTPVDVTLHDHAYWISGLTYGQFITLRGPGHFVCIRMGNGLEVWGRSATPLRMYLRVEALAGQINGRPVELSVQDGWTVLEIPNTSTEAALAGKRLTEAVQKGATTGIIRALHEVQQAMAWECAPVVRSLLAWDQSPEPALPNSPLQTEATYVRLEAAAAALCMGDRAAVPDLVQLLLAEARRDYAQTNAWGAKWWGFPTRSVTLEALMILHGTEVLAVLDEVQKLEVSPHGVDAIGRARRMFGKDGHTP